MCALTHTHTHTGEHASPMSPAVAELEQHTHTHTHTHTGEHASPMAPALAELEQLGRGAAISGVVRAII